MVYILDVNWGNIIGPTLFDQFSLGSLENMTTKMSHNFYNYMDRINVLTHTIMLDYVR